MTAPYKKEYELPNGRITSIVMDQAEFDQLVDGIEKDPPSGVTKEHIAAIRAEKHIPGIVRGTKTAWIFKRYDVETNIACVVVRGTSTALLNKLLREML